MLINNGQTSAVHVENVTKIFKSGVGSRSFKEVFVSIGRKLTGRQEQTLDKGDYQALKDISFDIKAGEFFGIVGRNGCGKSTLLKIIAGVYAPTRGSVVINGNLTPFIELGVGFNPELSGKDNVYLNGALLGFSRKQIDNIYSEIVSFAELEDFMNMKLKNYSSGMQVRLAFSIAIRAKTDVLVVDEVLAVGDAAFQAKCFNYFHELKQTGVTVVFVSHDRGALERFCDRGILINDGKIIEQGKITKVLSAYNNIVLQEMSTTGRQKVSSEDKRHSPSVAEIKNVYTSLDSAKKDNFNYDDNITVHFEVIFHKETVNPVFGVTVWQRNLNRPVFATNTIIENQDQTGVFGPGSVAKISLPMPGQINDGEYRIEPAVADESGAVMLDQISDGASFFVSGSQNPHSVISYTGKMHISR